VILASPDPDTLALHLFGAETHVLYITGFKVCALRQNMMQFYGVDFEEQISSSTLIVGLISVIMMLLPFSLSPEQDANWSSVLFIALPPDGNQTVANAAILSGANQGSIVFEIDNYVCAHLVCVMAAIEVLLLWTKVVKIDDNVPFTQANILRIGGLYTANSEFWFFVAAHHIVLFMLLLSPLSFHALFLFICITITTMAKLCEPTEEVDDDSVHSESYLNHVVIVSGYALFSALLFVVDGRMTRKSISDVQSSHIDLLFTQFVINTLLVVSHASGHFSLAACHYVRLSYTFICWILLMSSLLVG
jgi:hypothetical protein